VSQSKAFQQTDMSSVCPSVTELYKLVLTLIFSWVSRKVWDVEMPYILYVTLSVIM